nr:CPBP family intramembrane glutamic endopeptidase [uncultured Lachnoclostridium sp.]
MIFNHRGLWINPNFSFLNHFPTFLMVSFAEELVYRGWGLNALSAFVSERKANVVSTIFFIVLHLPAYFIKLFLGSTFPTAAVATQCAFVLGLLFGYLYRKGKSLWSPMLVHFLGVMLIG